MKIQVKQNDTRRLRRAFEKSPVVTGIRNSAVRLLYPLHCPVCDGIVSDMEEQICPECERKLRLLMPPWCMRCGKKVEEGQELCADCTVRQHTFLRGRALYEYDSIAPSLYRFKYSHRQEYAAFFGEQAAGYLGEFIRGVHPDALIPIPLHPARKNKRGYNQAELFADQLGQRMGIPVRKDYLVRVKNTVPLKYLNPSQRQNNLKKAFNIRGNDVKLEVIILIDDIYTTGATMDEAASVLKSAGVKSVYCLTLACGTGV